MSEVLMIMRNETIMLKYKTTNEKKSQTNEMRWNCFACMNIYRENHSSNCLKQRKLKANLKFFKSLIKKLFGPKK